MGGGWEAGHCRRVPKWLMRTVMFSIPALLAGNAFSFICWRRKVFKVQCCVNASTLCHLGYARLAALG